MTEFSSPNNQELYPLKPLHPWLECPERYAPTLDRQERELWYDGPNYTADAVIMTRDADPLILLITRRDGSYAVPGGFIDASESTERAAIREAYEETSVNLADTKSSLIFSGVVDDPRATKHAWIETTAFLFSVDKPLPSKAGDDALDTTWCRYSQLPGELYGSHREIINAAYERHFHLHTLKFPETAVVEKANGGHMLYHRFFVKHSSSSPQYFVKSHDKILFSDQSRANHSIQYLEKEALVYEYLRSSSYLFIPTISQSHAPHTITMEAYHPDENWYWRAPKNAAYHNYVEDILSAFYQLETIAPPTDFHENIEPTHTLLATEGWGAIHDTTDTVYTSLFAYHHEIPSADTLYSDLTNLRDYAIHHPPQPPSVLAHHDARQANIAWHPSHGARLVDWSWTGLATPKSDSTNFLIDLHKHGHDVSRYLDDHFDPIHALTLIGFWIEHSTWPVGNGNNDVRKQQFLSALSAYELFTKTI